MAVKPIVQPAAWATDAVYSTGPFVGMPQKAVPPAAFAAEGHRPGANFPTPAEYENSQQNRITALVRWVFSGSSTGAADAHIVETDAGGVAGLFRLIVSAALDQTSIIALGSGNVTNPVVLADSPGTNGTRYQANVGSTDATAFATSQGGGNSIGFATILDGSPAGASGHYATGDGGTRAALFDANMEDCDTSASGLRIAGSGANAGVCLRITNAGTGYSFDIASTGVTVPGGRIVVQRAIALTLDGQGPLGTPLALVPRAAGNTTPGAVRVSNTINAMHFVDFGGTERAAWSSQAGASANSGYVAGPTTTGAGGTIVTVNHPFVNGQRYVIRMSVRVGRDAGSTRNVLVTAQVAGVPLVFSASTIQLFQAGGASQLEESASWEAIYTATSTGTLAVTLAVGPTGGAGNIVYGQGAILVFGSFD